MPQAMTMRAKPFNLRSAHDSPPHSAKR
jgi:hypothetical protein